MDRFDDLYDTCDESGEPLKWEWDEDEMVFVALGSNMERIVLRPTNGEIERESSEEEEDLEEDF